MKTIESWRQLLDLAGQNAVVAEHLSTDGDEVSPSRVGMWRMRGTMLPPYYWRGLLALVARRGPRYELSELVALCEREHRRAPRLRAVDGRAKLHPLEGSQ